MTRYEFLKTGKEWKREDKHRIYLDRKATEELIGLNTERLDSGNSPRKPTFNGEKISNNAVYKLFNFFDFYFDVKQQTLCSRYEQCKLFGMVHAAFFALPTFDGIEDL